ncbi:MAG: sporulation integral membrane protein YtvI [Ruminococcaceae bacterium]|nr:sporulation integral membrane protein YtvI [Oscillospiraceae bacterium]
MRWERWASMLFCIAVGVVAVVFGIRYLLPILLPFLIAWALSLLIRPLARAVSNRFRVPYKVCAILFLLLFWSGFFFLIFAATERLIWELQRFLDQKLSEQTLSSFFAADPDYFEMISSRLPFFRRFGILRERLNAALSSFFSESVSSLATALPRVLGALLSGLPNAFLAMMITVISGFYFCTAEGDSTAVGAWLPFVIRSRLPALQNRIKRLSFRYLQAYLLLLFLTFAVLLLGFGLLRVEYAFLLSLVIAFIDMLPVLGVGTVLIPWAIIRLVEKDYRMGVGLLIIYGAVFVVRQVVEPRLVGKSLGLHPMLTLLTSFAGWRLFGFFGMLLAPFFAVCLKTLIEWIGCEKQFII